MDICVVYLINKQLYKYFQEIYQYRYKYKTNYYSKMRKLWIIDKYHNNHIL